MYTRLLRGNMKERDHLADPYVDGKMICRRIFRNWDGGMHLIDPVQDRDR